MVKLKQQLKDPMFRAWMKKTPRKANERGWHVFVQKKKGGKWFRARFKTWAEAYRFVARNINTYHDMALGNSLYPSRPPRTRNKTTGRSSWHFPVDALADKWCPFCRRMTEFKLFSRHHNFKPYLCGYDPQCSICGAPDKWTKESEWKW